MTLHLANPVDTRPDIDLLDGAFYADRHGARGVYR